MNLGICNFAISQLYDLIYGEYATNPLKGDNAYNWDKKFIEYEQGHKNLRTSQHYAKVLDKKVSEDMRILRDKFTSKVASKISQ